MIAYPMPILATASLLAGPVFLARSLRDLRTRRLIQNTPTARIRSLAMGRVELNGVVVAHSLLRAPLSDRECGYWEVDIATPSHRRQGWTVVHRNGSGNPFFLRDETGVALVYPKGADCRIGNAMEHVCAGVAIPDGYARYMSDQQLAFRHLWRLSALRFRERVLEEGERVYVLGTAVPRGRAETLSELESPAATRSRNPREARLRDLHRAASAVIRRGEHDPTFLISQKSERDLTLELGLRVVGQLVAGPALTLLGLGYWWYVLSTRCK